MKHIDEFYSIDEAAAILSISRSTLLRLINEGNLKAIRLGNRIIRISYPDLLKFLEKSGFEQNKQNSRRLNDD